jgi:methionyl-tRNA formyltransferase
MTKISSPTKTSGKLSIVFFGSGPVAAQSLELLRQDFEIEAVVTKPTTLQEMMVAGAGAPTHSVHNKTELDTLLAGKPFKSSIAVLIDFGIIVSQDVIDYFPLGIVNSHFSLLPEWRGADPISFAILSGQKQTGVSLMLLTAGMDEGPLLAQAPCDIPEGCTTPELTEALIQLSYHSLKHILPLYIEGTTNPAPQTQVTIASSSEPTYSRKLTKQDGLIDWDKPADQIEREIRAFIEWPKSRTTLAGKDVVILKATVVDNQGTPGSVEIHGKELFVYCGEYALRIEELKPAGKKEMPAAAFLAGYRYLL